MPTGPLSWPLQICMLNCLLEKRADTTIFIVFFDRWCLWKTNLAPELTFEKVKLGPWNDLTAIYIYTYIYIYIYTHTFSLCLPSPQGSRVGFAKWWQMREQQITKNWQSQRNRCSFNLKVLNRKLCCGFTETSLKNPSGFGVRTDRSVSPFSKSRCFWER